MEKKLLNGHEYYELTHIQASEIFTKDPICDRCSITLVEDSIIYSVALNMLLCKDCFNKWATTHIVSKEDEDFHRNNFTNTIKSYEAFCKYLKVQIEGNYNMYTEAVEASKAAGLSQLEYSYVLNNYKLLMERFPNTIDRFEREELFKIKFRDTCNKFLNTYKSFEWFIVKYFGLDKMNELISLAKANDPRLITELQDIWYKLPDNIFNLINNPEGWSEFLDLIEE